MSYNLDGKVANQPIKMTVVLDEDTGLSEVKTMCEKCGKLIQMPDCIFISVDKNKSMRVLNYLGTDHYIHETKSGIAVAYCSKYCKKKHNHRR